MMNDFKSKVKSVQPNGSYDWNNEALFNFEYEFENGQVITASHKKPEPRFAVGKNVHVTDLKTNDYGTRGKMADGDKEPYQPNRQSSPGHAPSAIPDVGVSILFQVALKEATIILGNSFDVSATDEEIAKALTDLAFLIAKASIVKIKELV